MRKLLNLNLSFVTVILLALSLPANAELIGTGQPTANLTSSGDGCDWFSTEFFTCFGDWLSE